MATVFNGLTSNSQELIGVPAPVKRLSRYFDFSDVRSGQPSDLTVIGQWENLQMLFIPKIRDGVYYLSQDCLMSGQYQ